MALKPLMLDYGEFPRHAALPMEVLTGTGVDPKPRLRVDVSDTAFFEGRMFQMYHEFNLATMTGVWLRFVAPVDCIVKHRTLNLVQGNLRMAVCSGGTPTGTWLSKEAQTSGVNAMLDRSEPYYTKQVLVDSGGVVTGANEIDVTLAETGTAQAISINLDADEVGRAAGTYFIELRNTGVGATRGVLKVMWEERQPRSSIIYT